MNVLLTGIAGFIGWRTAHVLLEAGHQVFGIDNLNDYYDIRLKFWRLQDLGLQGTTDDAPESSTQYPGLQFRKVDVENLQGLRALFAEHAFDAVINLASRAGVRASMDNPFIYFRSNTDGTVNLLECMRAFGVNKYVMASTSSLYAGQPLPFREDAAVNTPISPYAASKKAAEVAAYTWHHLYGIDVSICRYFTVYGPAGRPDMAPLRFIDWIHRGAPIQLFGDGSQRRDFTYVDDIALGTVKALKPVGYAIFNLGGGGEPLSILDMIACFERNLGKRALLQHLPSHKADMDSTGADIQQARTVLNWQPTTDTETGFRATVHWYLKHGSGFNYSD